MRRELAGKNCTHWGGVLSTVIDKGVDALEALPSASCVIPLGICTLSAPLPWQLERDKEPLVGESRDMDAVQVGVPVRLALTFAPCFVAFVNVKGRESECAALTKRDAGKVPHAKLGPTF